MELFKRTEAHRIYVPMQNVIYIKCCSLMHEMRDWRKGIQSVKSALSGGIHAEMNERVYVKFKHYFIFISLWMLKALFLFQYDFFSLLFI